MPNAGSLRAIWTWLPAFQVVAETQHLPTASRQCHTSVSALSRSVRLLEDALGRPLFQRAGRRLVLNASGEQLLSAVREALTKLSSEVDHLRAGSGAFHIATSEASGHAVVLPALRELQRTQLELTPYVHECSPERALTMLRSRELDVAFLARHIAAPGLVVMRVGEIESRIFCSSDHPLFAAPEPAPAEILRHRFCGAAAGATWDAWPNDRPRNVAVYVRQAETALLLCLRDCLLAALPVMLAETNVREGELRALEAIALPALPLYAVYLEGNSRAEALASAVRERLGPANATETVATFSPSPGESWLAFPDSLALRGEYAAAKQAYRSALRERKRSTRSARQDDTEVLVRIAHVELLAGRYPEARRTCADAIRCARGLPDAKALGHAMLALVECYRGRLDRAEAAIASARRLAKEKPASGSNRLRAEALIWRSAGNVALARGDTRAAAAAYRRGVETCHVIGDKWEHSIALYNLAETIIGRGKAAEALRLLERATAEKRALGDRWGLAYVHCARARAHLSRGHAHAALAEASEGLELALGMEDPSLVAQLNVTLGQAYQANGDLPAAIRALHFAIDAARRASPIVLAKAKKALRSLSPAAGM
jgi:DNA-binding transcriptional LysR family regulator